jgi:hypothetical protein
MRLSRFGVFIFCHLFNDFRWFVTEIQKGLLPSELSQVDDLTDSVANLRQSTQVLG